MPSSHSLDRIGATFDDGGLVANAGLIAPASLAQHLGLRELFEAHVDLGDAPGKAKVGHKAMTVIHAVLAGADSIDDCGVLRAGADSAVLGHAVLAPSTLGTFLRSFSWGHARQLDKVAGRFSPGRGRRALVPIWARRSRSIWTARSMRPTGHKSRAAAASATPRYATTTPSVRHRRPRRRGLHARLRGGNSHTARGTVGFLSETFNRVRAAGVSGQLNMRADSGFYSAKVVQACQRAGVAWSITVKLYKNVHAAMSTIPEGAWKPIPYWLDEGAEVAAIDWTTFKSRTQKGIACRLVVRRVRPTPGPSWRSWSTGPTTRSSPTATATRSPSTLGIATPQSRTPSKTLKYGVGLNHLPSGRFGANGAWVRHEGARDERLRRSEVV